MVVQCIAEVLGNVEMGFVVFVSENKCENNIVLSCSVCVSVCIVHYTIVCMNHRQPHV